MDTSSNVQATQVDEPQVDEAGRKLPAVRPSVWEIVVPRVTPSQAIMLVPDVWRRFTLVHALPAGEVVAKRVQQTGDAVFGEGLAVNAQGFLVANRIGAVTLDHLGRVWLSQLHRSPGLADKPRVMVVDGSIVIDGPVGPDWCIRATGDVEIRGFVNGATIVAGGSVLVRGDVIGTSSSSMIVTGWDVTVNQAADTEILAGHDVAVAQQLLNCNVTADGRILVGNPPMKSGVISGGLVHAGREIVVFRAGSTSVFPPDLTIGPMPGMSEGSEAPTGDLAHESHRLAGLQREVLAQAQKLEASTGSSHVTQLRQTYRSLWALWLRERSLLQVGDSQPYLERVAVFGMLALGSQVTIDGRRYTVGHEITDPTQFVLRGDQIVAERAIPLERPAARQRQADAPGPQAPSRLQRRLSIKLPSNLVHELDLISVLQPEVPAGQDAWKLLPKLEAELYAGRVAGTVKRYVVTDPATGTPQGHCYLRADVLRVAREVIQAAPPAPPSANPRTKR